MENSQFKGYLAMPAREGPGILVLHAWWGLNDTIKKVCDRLADEGFVAYAPDLFQGQVVTQIHEAEVLASTLEDSQAQMAVDQGVALLWEKADNEKQLGVIGFSLGAYYALKLSNQDPNRIRAVVLFYGSGPHEFSHSKAAFLGHFALNDDYEPAREVDALEASLRQADQAVTFYRYEEVGHWFFEPDRPDAYHPAVAQLAWDRTMTFLQEILT